MKKIMLFTAAGIIMFCLVAIATTQAMPRRIQEDNSFASNDILYVLNQKNLRNMDMELNNPVRKDNVLTYDTKVLHGKTIPNDGILIATRAHVHTDQQQHLKKDDEPDAYVDDDNIDDKEEQKEKAAIKEEKDDPAEPVTDQEEEKDTVEE
jgi:hypothetical protein